MRSLYIMMIVVLIGVSLTSKSYALRCGNAFIREGDSILKVLEYCGQALYTDYVVYNGRVVKMYIYKQNRREQRVYLKAGRVIGVE